jgi:hypothetical protein
MAISPLRCAGSLIDKFLQDISRLEQCEGGPKVRDLETIVIH